MRYAVTIIPLFILAACAGIGALGQFESNNDVGSVAHKGNVQALPGGGFRITAGGANIRDTSDAFHFVWRQVSGDLTLTTDLAWVGEGHPHRKAGWMIRQGLEPDAPYADVMVHGDGLIALQYRAEKGGETREIQTPIKAPATLRLRRDGDLFSLEVAPRDKPFQPVGAVTVRLSDPVYAGLAVASHDPEAEETALFTNVGVEERGTDSRVLESTLEVIDITNGERRIVFRELDHFEAPNWTPDGSALLFNRHGKLYTVPVSGGAPTQLNTGFAQQCNNDHGYSPDGNWLAISDNTEGSSQIYVLPATGGEPRLVTPLAPSYWHGWSPDGQYLAYPGRRDGEFDIYIIPVTGGQEIRLTEAPGLDDGPDYTPDGRYIYFNSVRTGVMKIYRMAPGGSDEEQVTFNEEYADWFPHPSPDGQWIVFLSFDQSVAGHPANKNVVLRLMPIAGGAPRVIATLFGGQGTINVPSWSPDSRYVAFVSYRLVAP